MKKIIKSISFFLILVLTLLIVRTFVMLPVIVSGISMEPTLIDKEILLLNKFDKEYKRFDIVVIKLNNEFLIKRIIALPGETIECNDNIIYINDIPIKKNYGYGITKDFSKFILNDDEYFVLGDNRSQSYDSRVFGVIKNKEIKGKTNFSIYPIEKFGKVK